MAKGEGPFALRGRRRERAILDELMGAVREGRSQVLALRGEAGVGKSALLDCLVERASDCRIARAAGVESEMELPFASLHQLFLSLPDRIDDLPAPQRDSLGVALGLRGGAAPEGSGLRFAVAGVQELCFRLGDRFVARSSTHAPRVPQQPRVDEERLVIGRLARRPAGAVLGVQFCREGSPRQCGVEALLVPPGRIFTMAVEAGSEAGVSQDVVDGAEAVERTADGAVEQGVLAVAIGPGGGDLDESMAGELTR